MDLLHPALLPGWAAEIGVTLLAKGSLLLLATWVLAARVRGASAATRYGVWMAGLVGLVFLPLATVAVPGANLGWVTSPVTALVPAAAEAGTAVPASVGVERMADGTSLAGAASVSDGAGALTGWAGVLLGVWLAGVAFFLLRLAADWIRIAVVTARAGPAGTAARALHRRGVVLARRQGVQRRIRVLVSDDMNVPVTWGVWRPVVLLPAEAHAWSPEHLDAVLMHELAHVRRWDYPTHLAAEVVRAVYWPNPLAWVACRKARMERERACDDAVLRSGTGSADYARLLLDLARTLSGGGVVRGVMAMARPSMLRTRIDGVLDRHSDRRPTGRAAVAVAVLVLLTLAMPVGSFRVWANPPQTEAGWAAALAGGDAATRLAAVGVLEAMGSPGAVGGLSGALTDPDARVRHGAARALGRVGDASAVPALVGLVTGGGDDLVQKRLAAAALRAIDERAATRALAARLEHRGPATRGVARPTAPDPAVWAPLVRVLLEDPDPEARSLAAGALVDLGCEAAVPELAQATEDPSPRVRLAAARALAGFDTWPARRALARLADDPDPAVRRVANDALECDGGS